MNQCGRDAVPSPEVPRIILEKRLAASPENSEDKEEIEKELSNLIQGRQRLTKITTDIINAVTGDEEETTKIMNTTIELTKFSCHKSIAERFHDGCFNLGCNGYALRQVNHFATMCQLGYDPNAIIEAMEKTCAGFQATTCGLH